MLVAVSDTGHPIVTLELPGHQDVGPSNNLAFAFNQIDRALERKLKYLCISPQTTPNPEGFKYD